MADTDSFINEVTEEVRRDRLYALFRRWAWLAVLVIVLAVGGAAYFEYRRAQAEAAAQDFGDAVIAALDGGSSEARIAALETIAAPGPQGEVLLALLAAGEAADDDDRAAAAVRLRRIAEAPELALRYRHLALLKAHLLAPASPEEARLVLGVLAEPGAPYAALAEEQLALLDISEGDVDAGLDRLRRLEIAADATRGLQQRAGQLIVAIESGAVLVDTAPEPAEMDAPGAGGASEPLDAGSDTDLLPPTEETTTDGAETSGAGATDIGTDEDAGLDEPETGSAAEDGGEDP